MQGFFNTDSGASENDDITKKGYIFCPRARTHIFDAIKFFNCLLMVNLSPCSLFVITIGKRNNSTRRYVPQKHSVAYALLITLYR